MSKKGKAFGHVAKWRKEQQAKAARERQRKADEFAALPQHERLRILLGISELPRE